MTDRASDPVASTLGGEAAGKTPLGGWGVIVFLFGLLGGLCGWLVLRRSDPRRGARVMKWGLIWGLAWIVIGAGAIVLLASVAGGGTSRDDPSAGVEITTGPASPAERRTGSDSALRGIPSEGFALGNDAAPVTVVVFTDLQSDYSAEASKTVIPDLARRHVRTGEVRLEMVPVAVSGVSEDTRVANQALWAAGVQGKAWQLAEELFTAQGPPGSQWLDEETIASAARAIDLDTPSFDAVRSSATAESAAEEAERFARTNNVPGTPYFLVRATNETTPIAVEDTTPAGFDAAISAVRSGGA